eukprot:TRINITY_DN1858_c0_g1_i1.p1 TRINITY_DN1858_c0_g1~~TRINITY_DN1858_c0_g1_i1.p1  ORF type:complete len:435 (-),score=41.08 TRINITY_DN1858_c0_g1_i1:301-1605(-)
MKLAVYIVVSLIFLLLTVFHAFSLNNFRFFNSVQDLFNSKLNVLVLGNFALMVLLCGALIVKQVFLGNLRSSDKERLKDLIRFYVFDCCLSLIVFREELGVRLVALFVWLLFIKAFHELCGSREDFFETTEDIRKYDHIRLGSLISLLIVYDICLIWILAKSAINEPSFLMFLALEHVILLIRLLSVGTKHSLRIFEIWRNGDWALKGEIVLVVELLENFCILISNMVLFFLITSHYEFPIYMIRSVAYDVRRFTEKIAAFRSFRAVLSKLSSLPDATSEQLNNEEGCVICRDTMNEAKVLPCGHIFHMNCLKTWVMKQANCPMCRQDISEATRHNQTNGDIEQPGNMVPDLEGNNNVEPLNNADEVTEDFEHNTSNTQTEDLRSEIDKQRTLFDNMTHGQLVDEVWKLQSLVLNQHLEIGKIRLQINQILQQK